MRKTVGLDMTAGSLGQGLSVGVGMALAGRLAKREFNVYVILGEGGNGLGGRFGRFQV